MFSSNFIQLFASAAMLASTVFIPLIAQNFGAKPLTIGLIVGAYNAFFMVSNYLFGYFSDKYGGKYILRIGLLLSAFVFCLQIFAKDLDSLLWLRSLTGFAAGTFPAALAVYSFKEHKGKMGKFTGYGSLGWGLGALLAGFIINNDLIFLLSAIFFLIAFFLTFQMDLRSHKEKEPALFPVKVFFKNARIYVPYFLRQLGAQAVWSIFPLYLVFSGADKTWVGIAYFVNLFSQFFMMQYIERFKNLYLFNIGLLCSVVTFIGYALFPHLAIVLIMQLLLSISFSTLQVGALQEILFKNAERSSAVGLLNSISNFNAVVGPFIAGYVVQYHGFSALMWTAAFFCFIGLVSFTTVLE